VVASLSLSPLLRFSSLVMKPVLRVFAFTPFTPLANVTGQPAMSVPLHWNDAGLPIGSMFTARFGDEATLFPIHADAKEPRRHAA
jgi:amidase